MRLVFVNRFYWPETPATGQLLTDLAEAMAQRGHDVTVITSGINLPACETHRGVRILRVRGTRLTRAGLGGKALDFATFYLGALLRLLGQAREDTVVVAMTDPPLFGIGAWLVARVRGARVVHWVQDIYPELAMELGGGRGLGLLRLLRDASWRGAEACVTLGADMAGVVATGGVAAERMAIIPNWAPANTPTSVAPADSLRRECKLEGKFVVAYAGNLGRVHDLLPVIAAAAALRDSPEIAFVLVGGGAQRGALIAEVHRRQLTNVTFHPAQPRSRLGALLALGDVHLVTLRPGCERLVYPSKLYGIAAAGRPILFIGPAECEVAATVTRHELGRAVTRHDPAVIAAALRGLAAAPADRARFAAAGLRFAAAHTPELAAAHWQELFTAVEACEPLRPQGITPSAP